jgi:twitching motility protein PilT
MGDRADRPPGEQQPSLPVKPGAGARATGEQKTASSATPKGPTPIRAASLSPGHPPVSAKSKEMLAGPAEVAGAPTLNTGKLITVMVRAGKHLSDLIFSPGRPPQMEVEGQLVGVKIPGLAALTGEQTASIAAELIGSNAMAAQKLREEGAAELSYSLPKVARFRVNIFMQRGTCAIVMRVIPDNIPDFEALQLPATLAEVARLKNGIVLVTGPAGSGKSSTLAALLDRINAERACHIITIEDPIEFLQRHKKATVHQRELHGDTPSFALALRSALRQGPKVILVSEMRDRETMEIAIEAAETGRLILSTLPTIDTAKTVERIVSSFPSGDHDAIRSRLAKAFRFLVSQRLVPRKDGKEHVAVFEILKTSRRTREYVERGECTSLVDAMRDGGADGMQCFDGELERMAREGTIEIETALAYASNPGNLRSQISGLIEEKSPPKAPVELAVEQRNTEIVRY